ncbi:MAG: hypothetical protein GY853_04725 [PVC group bacterium]|nr:hypothetical protein [PVC group bacterium]
MKDLDKLIRLQEIDSQIFKLKSELESDPQKIAALESDFQSASESLTHLEGELKQFQLKRKEKELDLDSKEQNIAKQKTQLFQVKSNKEYNALQLEINKVKADNSLLEEEIIGILEQVEKAQQAVAKEKENVAVKDQEFKNQKKEIEIAMTELKQQIDGLKVKRDIIQKEGITPEVLELYTRIIAHTGELAVVPVVTDVCQGCFRTVRVQIVNELHLGKLVTCENCARILYVETNEE